jgi:hypothetical protein
VELMEMAGDLVPFERRHGYSSSAGLSLWLTKGRSRPSVNYQGRLYLSGESFSGQDDDPEVDGWTEHGYWEPTAKGGHDKVKQNRRKRIEEHPTLRHAVSIHKGSKAVAMLHLRHKQV